MNCILPKKQPLVTGGCGSLRSFEFGRHSSEPIDFNSVQVTIKTNLLAELEHQALNIWVAVVGVAEIEFGLNSTPGFDSHAY